MVGTDSRKLRPTSLRQLFPTARFVGGEDILVSRVATNPSTCRAGDLVVIDCASDDPHQGVADALARGAVGVLCEQMLPCPLPQCLVPDTLAATAIVADALVGFPSRDIFTVGVIGEAGKTSTALLVAAALRAAGIRTAYNTDLGMCDGVLQVTPKRPANTPARHAQWLADARDCGCATAVLELTDSVLANQCLEPLQLDLLVVTGNPGRTGEFGPHRLQAALDHMSPSGMAVVSADCPQAVRMVTDAGVQRLTYGMRKSADISGKIFEQQPGETTLLVTAGDSTAVMETGMTGSAMAANQLAAIAVGLMSELTLPAAIEAIRSVGQIPGRMDRLSGFDSASVVLDSAGSNGRLAESLRALRRERQGGRLWCLLAAPEAAADTHLAAMGRTAERYADHVIYTTGKGGKAEFLKSAHALLDGVKNPSQPRLIADRQRAIEWAVRHAAPGDTILIAGGFSATSPQAHRADIAADRALVMRVRQHADVQRETETHILKFPTAVM